jgi:hypothetical protein
MWGWMFGPRYEVSIATILGWTVIGYCLGVLVCQRRK